MKLLVIGSGGREHALCWKLAQSPKVEKIYCAPGNGGTSEIAENVEIGAEGIPNLLKFAHDKKIDLTIVGPEAPLVAGIVDEFEKNGLEIFGPSALAAMLEGSKAFAKQIMVAAGVPTARYEVITNIDEIQVLVDEFPNGAAVKADGLAQGKGVIICHDAGEIVGAVNRLMQESIFGDAGKKIVVEELLQGEEASVLAFCDGKTAKLMVSSQDHKRIFDGDKGPNCYSSDTEILTTEGWKTFANVYCEDMVATYNVSSKAIEFQHPMEVHWIRYKGKMYNFRHRLLDLLVTPNHRMLVEKRKSKVVSVYEAQNLHGESNIPISVNWNGTNPDYHEIPEYDYKFSRYLQKFRLSFIDWVRFLAFYLSEGYATKGKEHRILVSQTQKSPHFQEIRNVLSKLPFAVTYQNNNSSFRINSAQLVKELRSFGFSYEKFIPNYIKSASKEIILEFLKHYNMGDGDIHAGKMRFTTSSKRMADDLQELLFKIGLNGVISLDKRPTMINPINGKQYLVTHPVYSIEGSPRKTVGIRKKDIKILDYEGYVGCVTVPNSFVVVRRNNRIAISGNTGGMGAYAPAPITKGREKEIHERVFVPVLREMGKRGAPYKGVLYAGLMIDQKTKNFNVLEFNCRFGDPEAQVILPLLETDLIEVAEACIHGTLDKVDLKWKNGAACCVVLASKGYPEKYEKGKAIEGLGNAKAFENVVVFHAGTKKEGGKIVTNGGRSLGVTGLGMNIKGAISNAYTGVSQINFEGMHFRHDIGKRALK